MLCQHCNTNQAVYHFQVDFGSQIKQFHLCETCAGQLARQYQALFANSDGGNWAVPGPWAAPPVAKMDQVPAGVDQAFNRRRQLTQLQSRLRDAVAGEDYETAATLRDEIASLQNAMADSLKLEKKENSL